MELTRETENPVAPSAEPMARAAYVPHVDIYETDSEVTVVADVPGVEPGDLRVDFHDGILTLHGRAKERHPERSRMMLREYGVGDFHRTFRVDETIDVEKIRADSLHGSLTLHLPKVEPAVPRRIDVQVR